MTNEAMSPLRRRMIEDMTIRNFGPKTQNDYIRSVKNLAMFLGRSPDTASNEVRRFQLRLSSDGISAASMNSTVSGLRFFFRVTLAAPPADLRAAARRSRMDCRASGSPRQFRRRIVRWFVILAATNSRENRKQDASSKLMRYCAVRTSTLRWPTPWATPRNHPP